MRFFILLFISLALTSFVSGQAPAPSPDVVVEAGTLLDRPGKEPRRNASIVIRNGHIASVEDGFGKAPEGATVVDLRDRFVLPGLIDCHVHLTSDRAGIERQLADVTDSVAMSAYEAGWNARKTLEAGFTTVRNLGSADGVTLALRDSIAKGWASGPRIIDAGTMISTTSGHGDPTLGLREELHPALDRAGNVCNGVEDCRRAVRKQISRGADVIKMATTGGVNSQIGLGLGAQMFEDEVKAIVDTAHQYGKKVAVHAHGADGINLALRAGADSIEHGTMLDDESLKLFRSGKAYYVPTLSTVNGYLERIAANPNAYIPEVRKKIDWRIGITGEALRRAVPAGVRVAFGTDAGVSKHGRNADEFELMVKHGMTPATAIQAATTNAADLLGIADQVGSLEPGRSADLIAVAGDPLRDVTTLKKVSFVMKEGKLYKHERAAGGSAATP
jgi:imidazolonepropionase-like amidohydrolase